MTSHDINKKVTTRHSIVNVTYINTNLPYLEAISQID